MYIDRTSVSRLWFLGNQLFKTPLCPSLFVRSDSAIITSSAAAMGDVLMNLYLLRHYSRERKHEFDVAHLVFPITR